MWIQYLFLLCIILSFIPVFNCRVSVRVDVDSSSSHSSAQSHRYLGPQNRDEYYRSEGVYWLDLLDNGEGASAFSALAASNATERAVPLWEKVLSGGIGAVPLVGTLKSLVELISGEDMVTQQQIPRWLSAIGIVAGVLPFGGVAERTGAHIVTYIGEKEGANGMAVMFKGLLKHFPSFAKEFPTMIRVSTKEGYLKWAEEWSRPSAKMLADMKGIGRIGFLVQQGLNVIQTVGEQEYCRYVDHRTANACLGAASKRAREIQKVYNEFVSWVARDVNSTVNWAESAFNSTVSNVENVYETDKEYYSNLLSEWF